MSEITAKNGKVIIPTGGCGDYGCQEQHEVTPAEARELSMQLMRASYWADSQLAEIAKACADGHDWNSGHNNWGSKETTYLCQRPGCDAAKTEPGWLPFEPKTHIVSPWGTTADCTGPGCHHCETEEFGQLVRKVLSDAAKTLDLTLFAKDEPHAQS